MKQKSRINLCQFELIGPIPNLIKLSSDSNFIQGFVTAPVRCIHIISFNDWATIILLFNFLPSFLPTCVAPGLIYYAPPFAAFHCLLCLLFTTPARQAILPFTNRIFPKIRLMQGVNNFPPCPFHYLQVNSCEWFQRLNHISNHFGQFTSILTFNLDLIYGPFLASQGPNWLSLRFG